MMVSIIIITTRRQCTTKQIGWVQLSLRLGTEEVRNMSPQFLSLNMSYAPASGLARATSMKLLEFKLKRGLGGVKVSRLIQSVDIYKCTWCMWDNDFLNVTVLFETEQARILWTNVKQQLSAIKRFSAHYVNEKQLRNVRWHIFREISKVDTAFCGSELYCNQTLLYCRRDSIRLSRKKVSGVNHFSGISAHHFSGTQEQFIVLCPRLVNGI